MQHTMTRAGQAFVYFDDHGVACLWAGPPWRQILLCAVVYRLSYPIVQCPGGHLNPAVTVGFLAAGKIPALRAFLYIVFQCLGACTGSAIVLAVCPSLL